ncbi:endonuclease domain-containing protein [Aquimarina sp. ERC-38]|uniref:endonuclease domain-containing protein n=1 Tax=Aquimarina sp. ERC-38 TaxID=2949996 RepID=UPI002245E139|nr:endonuclease domain-containing protein [Aquimarina sp. ERC-38]UZO82073.1 endonuclease domain-containing protein [Aquimarina sp. ERC-38]
MKRNQKTHDKPELKKYRKDLRKNLTSSEAFLWTYLQKKKLEGRKFRRQHSIHNFIVDFYCAEEKLVIELDGEYHNTPHQMEKDKKRDKTLNDMGFTVLRFENQMVFNALPSVLKEITDHFNR